jgi:diguanylate cyclase (GGDEF)-like protein
MEHPLGLLIADDQQPDIDVSWLTIPGGEEEPADALCHGAAKSKLCPSPLDPMAKLPNRELFCEHLDDLLRYRIEKDRTTVIVFNIEHLRDISDTHGRQVGDQLLRCVAERLRRRFGDNLAYFDGGLFAAVFDEPRQRLEAVHDSATAVFAQPFALLGRPIPATVRCALARYPVDGQGAEALLRCAERALDKVREHHQKPSRALPSANEEILDTVGCEDSEEERSHPAPTVEELELLMAARSSDT